MTTRARAKWLCTLIVLALAALTAGAQTASAQTCMGDKAGFGLNCTANDVNVARFNVLNNVTECTAGDDVFLDLQAEEVATSSERYDIGLFVAQDGGNALTGLCLQDFLPNVPTLEPHFVGIDHNKRICTGTPSEGTGTGPYFNGECEEDGGDFCGDLRQGITTLRNLGFVTIKCQDFNGDGKADVSACTSWDNTKNNTCTEADDTLPNNGAKCKCEHVPVGDITVKGKIVVDKVTDPPGDDTSFNFSLTGGPESVSLGCSLTDAAAPFEFLDLQPGTTAYSLIECTDEDCNPGAPPGWALGTPVCTSDKGNSQTAGNIVLHNGETVTCTFTDTLVDLCVTNNVICPADGECGTYACNPTTGQCEVTAEPSTTVCRASAGQCDVAESCTGDPADGVDCPDDEFEPSTTSCVGTSNDGACDGPDSCLGGANTCVDGYTTGNVCRPSEGQCDVAESCTGTESNCPVDAFQPNTTSCVGTSNDGACDVTDSCDGAGACVDGFATATTICRGTGGNACDVPESCSGSSGACPDDGFAPATSSCVGASNVGACDGTDSCNGAGVCVDGYQPATFTCRVPATECDVTEFCTGSASVCPTDNPGPPECNSLTDTEFCPLPNDQFKLLFLQDPCTTAAGSLAMNNYRLNASNPGQFYYNVFDSGTPGDPVTLDITIPYPFVTQGATPIQTHDSFETVDSCFQPSPNLNSMYIITCDGEGVSPAGNEIVLLSDYSGTDIDATNVTQCHVSGNFPATGVLYVTLHVDYGLKKTSIWQQGLTNQALSTSSCNVLDGATEILAPETYSFSYNNGTSGSTDPTSTNIFKKNPGSAGNLSQFDTAKPKAGVGVQLISPTNTVVGTATSDENGVWQIVYKHTGKAANYTVKLLGLGRQQTITLKANGFVLVNFEDLP